MVQPLTQTSTATDFIIDVELDARGLRCPMPLLKAKQAIHAMKAGQTLRVSATDPGTQRDFLSWTKQSGDLLISATETDGLFVYVLKKQVLQK